MSDRDVAIVLSGGGMNGILLELGFLQRFRETSLWPRVGSIYGTSAGALAGTMAALDRLDDLEAFPLELQPDDIVCRNGYGRCRYGLHDYTLPATIAARLIDPIEARALAAQTRDRARRDRDGRVGPRRTPGTSTRTRHV